MVQILFILLLIVMIIDATMPMADARKFPEIYEEIGLHPFQWWLLMNSSGFGSQIYSTLEWIFPVLVTGMVFYSEQKSSMCKFLVIRKNKKSYFLSHVLAAFLVAFLFFSFLLVINVLVTWCVFPVDTLITEQYEFCIPNEGTFASELYRYGPFIMAIVYSLLNALAMAVYAVFAIALQINLHFRNQYIAIAVPVILVYTITFLLESTGLYSYDMNVILQPRAACVLADALTIRDVCVTFGGWLLIDTVLVVIGIQRNRDIL